MKKIVLSLLFTLIIGAFSIAQAVTYSIVESISGTNYSIFKSYNGYGVLRNADNPESSPTIVVPAFYDSIEQDSRTDMLIIKKNQQYGVMTAYGTVVVSPQWDYISGLDRSYLKVKKDSKVGVVSTNGKLVVKPLYDDISVLGTYNYYYENNNRYGLMDASFDVLTAADYTYLSSIDSHYIAAGDEVGYGVLDYNANIVIPLINDWKPFDIINGYIVVKLGENYGLVDFDGNILLECEYPSIKDIKEYGVEIRIALGRDYLNGIVDINTGKYIVQMVYDKVQFWEEYGYYKVKKDGKWGAINSQGQVVFPCKYGPLEINRMVKKLPIDTAYLKAVENNAFNIQLAEVDYYCNVEMDKKAAKILKKVLESSSLLAKQKAQNLIYKYNIDPYMY